MVGSAGMERNGRSILMMNCDASCSTRDFEFIKIIMSSWLFLGGMTFKPSSAGLA